MSPTRDADRRAILRRRAAFLGSALAVAGGCSRGAPAAEPGARSAGEENVVSVPAAPPDAGESNEALPEPEARTTPERATPSLEMPSGVGETARQHYETLFKQMRSIYGLLDAIDLPKQCNAKDPSCDGRWRKLADDLLEVESQARWISSPCKGSSADAKAYDARAEEHAAHVRERLVELRRELDQTLAAAGEAAQKRWKQHEQEARFNKPQVCLSFGCVDW